MALLLKLKRHFPIFSVRHAKKSLCLSSFISVFSLFCVYYYVTDADLLQKTSVTHAYFTNYRRWQELLNITDEHVWPDPVNEPDDRILSQIRFMKYYGSLVEKRSMKYIVRVGSFNFENVLDGQGQFEKAKCPIQECWMTADRSFARSADALLISQMGHGNWWHYLPKPAHQVWIAQHWESAVHDRINTRLVRHQINWTASFRRDSTLTIGYGKYAQTKNLPKDSQQDIDDYSAGKSKQVAWLVTNCNARNNRYEYAQELSKYIEVDIYGYCGNLSCPRTGPQSCHNLLVTTYRFFLAFENSNCKDYITEKLYHAALQHNVIPIVLGARSEDYEALAPSGSYIDVAKFSSPRELASYLHTVAANSTLYNEYFKWKKTWTMIDDRYWCRLCMLLHLQADVGYVSWYEDYRNWWNGACDVSSVQALGLSIVMPIENFLGTLNAHISRFLVSLFVL